MTADGEGTWRVCPPATIVAGGALGEGFGWGSGMVVAAGEGAGAWMVVGEGVGLSMLRMIPAMPVGVVTREGF